MAAATLVIAAACDQQARTTLPPPSNAYAKTSTNPAPAKGTCLTDDEIQAVRNEIAWQQFYNAAIQCEKNTPSFRPDYGAFRNKFRTDNEVNSAPLQRAITKHRMNVNAFKTEVANRDGASAGGNPKYCANAYDGFRWALSQQVNSLSQVPPMLDFSGDMGLRVCTAGTPAAKPAAKPARK
ncbi:hypothetical protein [Reyranella sp. CPCC 100927]|uniref:hypothetical protein n=1 Tax=Reyranella sp. CPCC 100927 TaxID=2599616 RepID=UPI0011B7B441|nr:hypothetical protein [Reyranella sp. CPCC 100927]TWT10120.1 hypothetical protein FQU96_18700 [Reyranella sp. CPCC 100927]